MTIHKLRFYIIIFSIIIIALLAGSHFLQVNRTQLILIQAGVAVLFPLVAFGLVVKCYSETLKAMKNPEHRSDNVFKDILQKETEELSLEKQNLEVRLLTREEEHILETDKLEAELNALNGRLKETEKGMVNFFLPVKKIFFQKENNSSIAERISSILNDLHALIKKTAEDMKQQSELLALTFESYGDTGNSLRKVDFTISEAQELAKELFKSVNTGKEALGKATEGMENILSYSQEMENIITLIVDIADQTDLLAINASIESAHTGALGKGFSVIAQEIKKLAFNSKGASGDVKKIISNIIEKIQYQSELIENLSDLFDRINEYIEKTNIINEKIYGISKDGMIQSKEVQTAVSILDSIAKKILESSDKELLQSYEAKNIIASMLDTINQNYEGADENILKLLKIEKAGNNPDNQ